MNYYGLSCLSALIYSLVLLLFTGGSGCSSKLPGEERPDGSTGDPQPELVDTESTAYWQDASLVWSDEFDGDQLDTDKWTFETGANGWGNNEWQHYVADSNVAVGGGTLKIIAKKTGAGQHTGDYTSARLNTKEAFTYGRMEIKARIPEYKGRGIWPALWMLGRNIPEVGWPACGELDIMEYVSYDPDYVHFSIHSTANNHRDGTQVTSGPVLLETIEEEFHAYGLLWTRDYIKFYIDDPQNIQLSFRRPAISNDANWPFSKPFYFLMNIAVGGDWGGLQGVDDSIFPAVMEVDYVRVYQVK